MGQLMIMDEGDFRKAVRAAVRDVALYGDRVVAEVVDHIVAAAKEYAPVYQQEREEAARESGAAACTGECCT
jgi:hypothetical protein